jgi:DNA-binding transcriptional MerR regulator
VFRRLAIIDAAQRVGFRVEEIRDVLGSRDELAHERLRHSHCRSCPSSTI